MKNIFESTSEEIEKYVLGNSGYYYETESGSWILTRQGLEDIEFESEEELLDYIKESNL